MRLVKLRTFNFMAEDVDLNFGDVTILWGPNGSQKTGVVHALQLLVNGYVPELGKTPETVMRLARDGDFLRVQGWFNDGDRVYEVRREFRRNTNIGTKSFGTVKKEVHQTFDPHARTNTEKDAMLRRALGGIEEIWRPEVLLEMSKDDLRRRLLALIGPGDEKLLDYVWTDCPDWLLPETKAATVDAWLFDSKAKARRRIDQSKKELREHELTAAKYRGLVAVPELHFDPKEELAKRGAALTGWTEYQSALSTLNVARVTFEQAGPCPEERDTVAFRAERETAKAQLFAWNKANAAVQSASITLDRLKARPPKAPLAVAIESPEQAVIEKAKHARDQAIAHAATVSAELRALIDHVAFVCPKCEHVEAETSPETLAQWRRADRDATADLEAARVAVVELEQGRRDAELCQAAIERGEAMILQHNDNIAILEKELGELIEARDELGTEELLAAELATADAELEKAKQQNRMRSNWELMEEDVETAELKVESKRNKLGESKSHDEALEDYNTLQAQLQDYERLSEEWRAKDDADQELADARAELAVEEGWLAKIRDLEDELIGVVAHKLERSIEAAMVKDANVQVRLFDAKGKPTLRFLVNDVDWTTLSHGEKLQFQKGLVAALCAGAGGEFQPLLVDAFEAIDKRSRVAFLHGVAEDVQQGLFDQAIVVGCPDEDPSPAAIGAAAEIVTHDLWKGNDNAESKSDQTPRAPGPAAEPSDEALADRSDPAGAEVLHPS